MSKHVRVGMGKDWRLFRVVGYRWGAAIVLAACERFFPGRLIASLFALGPRRRRTQFGNTGACTHWREGRQAAGVLYKALLALLTVQRAQCGGLAGDTMCESAAVIHVSKFARCY